MGQNISTKCKRLQIKVLSFTTKLRGTSQILTRIAALRALDILGRALSDNLATTLASLGAEVDNPICNAHYIEVMLYDDSRITAIHQAVDDIQQLAYILEMETRSGLIEDIERATRIALRELRSELYALRLATRERCAWLAEREVAQAHLLDSLELSIYRWYMLEELNGHIDGHVEHIVDALALILNLQRLAIIAIATALTAAHIYIGQEVHLYGLVTRTTTRLTATTLDIEREATRLITSYLRIGCLLEELAYVGKDIGICRGVTARCATNRRLIHHNQLVDMLHALNRSVWQSLVKRTIQVARENGAQRAIYKRRLTRARYTRDADQLTERNAHIYIFEVVARSATQSEILATTLSQLHGRLYAPTTREVVGSDALAVAYILESARSDNLATTATRQRADIHNIVRCKPMLGSSRI